VSFANSHSEICTLEEEIYTQRAREINAVWERVASVVCPKKLLFILATDSSRVFHGRVVSVSADSDNILETVKDRNTVKIEHQEEVMFRLSCDANINEFHHFSCLKAS